MRMQEALKVCGLELQSGFTPDRGSIDGLFSVFVALQKRKENDLDSWILFVDLVKAFGSVPLCSLCDPAKIRSPGSFHKFGKTFAQ